MPSAFKPAYLIHGDDHGRIAERRAKLCELAQARSGAQGLELFSREQGAEAVAAALSAMTFAIGRRFLVVDGVERWKDRELGELEGALAQIPPDTTVAFFAREDGRLTAPKRLHDAVTRAGGDISAERALKPWELPKWAVARARSLGLDLAPDAARMLVAQVGDRQQRLLRELEKLALALEPGARVDSEIVAELSAASAERRAWSLADALLSGSPQRAIRDLLALRAQGERLGGLTYWMGSRLRQAHAAALALEAGKPSAQVKKTLRMPPKAADQLLADASRIGSRELRSAIGTVADLELASRGGGRRGAGEDTLALLAIRKIAG